jgi:hypothetical protein
MLESMESIVKLGLVGAGVWAVHRAIKANDLGVPLGHAFAEPFAALEALRAQADEIARLRGGGVKIMPGVQASFPLPGGGAGMVKLAPSGLDLSIFQRRII